MRGVLLEILARVAAPVEGKAQLYIDRLTRRLRVALPDETTLDIEHIGRRNQPNGYPGLDANSLIAYDQLGTGTPDGTKFLRDDQVWAVPPGGGGGGLGDPGANGIVVRTATNTTTARTIVGTSPVTVTNGNGVSDNPTISMPAASGSQAGHLTATDWTTFNGKVGTSRSISTSAPLSGGGDLSADRSLSLSYGTGLTTSGGALVVDTSVIAEVADLAGYQPLDSDLTALAGLSSTGLIARTGAGTAAARTLTAGAGVIITNGDGVSGNPTIATDPAAPFYVTTTRIYYAQVENNSPVFVGATGSVTLGGTTTVAANVTNTYNSCQITCTNANSSWASRTSFQNVRIGHNPLFVGQFISAAATTSHRVWLTLAVSIGTGATPSGQSCGLVYDPGVSANWQAFAYDGTTMSYTDTGVTYAVDTRYQWSVRTTSSGLYVKIWDATGSEPAETAHTTNLPAAGTNLYPGLVLFLRTAAGSSVFKYLSQQCSMTVNNA